MSSQLESLPGGVAVVTAWVDELYGSNPGSGLWASLDDPLRLALAQGWVLHTVGQVDQVMAEALARSDSTHPDFGIMLGALIERWRSVYEALQRGYGVLARTTLAGVNMELVVLTPPEYVGIVPPGGANIPAHSFITRLADRHEWTIAALARRLPVPGWPPREKTIPDLL